MVATQRLLVSPRILGEDEPNLTSIFFRWVETTNQISLGLHNPIYPSPYHHALYLHHHHIISYHHTLYLQSKGHFGISPSWCFTSNSLVFKMSKGSHLHEFDRLCHRGAVTQVVVNGVSRSHWISESYPPPKENQSKTRNFTKSPKYVYLFFAVKLMTTSLENLRS